MTNVQLVTFTCTIVSGSASLVLGILAIWLSLKQNKQAQSSLDKVKELTSEIRSLVNVGIKQQDKFSSKMLDSILSEENYGFPTDEDAFEEYIENTIRSEMKQTEEEVLNLVEEKMQNLSSDEDNESNVKESIEEIQNIIETLTNKTISEVSDSVKLPKELKLKLKSLIDYPAHYLLLTAIINEDISNIEEVKKISNKYGIPKNSKNGIKNLLEEDILTGEIDNFGVNSKYKPFIKNWINNNLDVLNQISSVYKGEKESASTIENTKREKTKNIAKNIDF